MPTPDPHCQPSAPAHHDPSAPTASEALSCLETVLDPEIGIDIVSLGLIAAVRLRGDAVEVDLTPTSAACPLGPALKADAEAALLRSGAFTAAEVRLVYEPPWTPDGMSPEARRRLGWRT